MIGMIPITRHEVNLAITSCERVLLGTEQDIVPRNLEILIEAAKCAHYKKIDGDPDAHFAPSNSDVFLFAAPRHITMHDDETTNPI